uniref:UPAR/Ly6 domain-containing protein n=1 Tax=Myripristis murdjan TaxID=586833 RepID=A0A668A702_9TELE
MIEHAIFSCLCFLVSAVQLTGDGTAGLSFASPCPNITSQCLPDERCSSSMGRYGPVHILSAQGCIAAQLCGSHEIISYRGVGYNVSHSCCCRDQCNRKWCSFFTALYLTAVVTVQNKVLHAKCKIQ